MDDFYVYVLFRNNGQPFYVGKGRGDRWLRHEQKRTRHNKHLSAVLAKENYVFPKVKIAENLAEAEAFAIERAFIAAIGRVDEGTGILVNQTKGGDGTSGYVYTDEVRAKMSALIKKRFEDPEYRKRHAERPIWTEDLRERRRQSQIQLWQDESYRQNKKHNESITDEHRAAIKASLNRPETRARMSESAKNKPPVSEETRQKISIAHKGKKLSEEHRSNLSAAKKGIPVIPVGTKLSDHHRSRISEGKKGKSNGLEGKVLTDEHRANLSRARRGVVARKFAEAEGWGMRA